MLEPDVARSRHETFEAIALAHFDTVYTVAIEHYLRGIARGTHT
jgi:hypothetical protein